MHQNAFGGRETEGERGRGGEKGGGTITMTIITGKKTIWAFSRVSRPKTLPARPSPARRADNDSVWRCFLVVHSSAPARYIVTEKLTVFNINNLGHLLAFLIQSPSDFHETLRNEWRRQDSESTIFCERSGRHPDPKRINPEIWIRILDHFWLRLYALVQVCTLRAQSISIMLWDTKCLGVVLTAAVLCSGASVRIVSDNGRH